MSLMTDTGLVQFVLEEGRDIQFTNEDLNAKVNQALTALAANRQRELRTLKITARGEGSRTVTVTLRVVDVGAAGTPPITPVEAPIASPAGSPSALHCNGPPVPPSAVNAAT